MRYFRVYEDDTLNGLYNHRNGELVNRYPLVFKLTQPKRVKGRYSASVRMGNRFAKQLKEVK